MSIQRSILQASSQIPQLALEQLLRRKLKEEGVLAWRAGAKALAEHLIENGSEEFHFKDSVKAAQSQITLKFSQDDIKRLEDIADAMTGEVTEIAQNIVKSTAENVLTRYKSEWANQRRHQERFVVQFRSRLEDRWGIALDGLRMLLDLCMNEGEKFHKKINKSGSTSFPFLKIALSKMHIRACQITSEIICLLENGFPNGALARWRTLHEIEVVSTVLLDGGNQLAERFLDHVAVDDMRSLEQFEKNCAAMGDRPPTLKTQREIRRVYAEALKRHGSHFGRSYGWAAEYLGNQSPRFSNLEEAAGAAWMRSHYKFASYSIHASSKSLTLSAHSLSVHDWPIAGASNAGLSGPGQNAAVTLLRITYLMLSRLRSLDHMIMLSALIDVRDQTVAVLERCENELHQDELAIRRAVTDFDIESDTRMI